MRPGARALRGAQPTATTAIRHSTVTPNAEPTSAQSFPSQSKQGKPSLSDASSRAVSIPKASTSSTLTATASFHSKRR